MKYQLNFHTFTDITMSILITTYPRFCSGDDEYMNFIAVEAGIVVKSIRIEPVSCFEAYQTFEFIEPKREKVVEDFFDLFDGYC